MVADIATARVSEPETDAEAADLWLRQFERVDRSDASQLLAAIRNVSADEFHDAMTELVQSRVEVNPAPVGLFVETERGHRNGKAYRLFKEGRRRPRRATGRGPRVIDPRRTVDPEVGSEGVIAQILTAVIREKRHRATLHPGPDTIRERRIRRFILVTDFVGSGNRICRYLDAAWRVSSVRSWWSARRTKGISFEVIAFSVTEAGGKKIKAHPCGPKLHVVEGCPTIDNTFEDPEIQNRMRNLCVHYGSFDHKFDPLGYGGSGALITFAHGMPNNAPAIFHKTSRIKTRPWTPMYPQRVTSGRRKAIGSIVDQSDEIEHEWKRVAKQTVLRSPRFVSAPTVLRDAVEVLLSLDRTPREATAVSARTGLSVKRVEEALERIDRYGWVDDKRRIAEKGRRELARLRAFVPAEVQFKSSTTYTPRSLRAPRDV